MHLPSPSGRSRIALAGALALSIGYALPLFWPPASPLLVPPLPGASMMERLFPGMPAAWILARLACLAAAGVILLLLPEPADKTDETWRAARVDATNISPQLMRGLLLVSGVQAALALFAASLAWRPWQLLYLVTLAVPVVALAYARRAGAAAAARAYLQQRRATLLVLIALCAGWLVLRGPSALHDPRIATFIDGISGFQVLEQTARPDLNLLTDHIYTGITAVHLVPQGAGWIHYFGMPIHLRWVQAIQLLWLALTGLMIGVLAAETLGRQAAPVAAAAFLFAPVTLHLPFILGALGLGTLYVSTLAVLALLALRAGSPVAIAGLGLVGGLAATHPALLPGVAVVALFFLWNARQQWLTLPWQIWAIAALTFFAAVWPSLPSVSTARGMAGAFTLHVQWAALEAARFGRIRPTAVDFVIQSGAQRFPLDTIVATILTPFAMPRTSMRLLGDSGFEPLAVILMVLGLITALRTMRRSRTAVLLLLLFSVGLLPILITSYDRPSITRGLLLPLAMALLAGNGWLRLRDAYGRFRTIWPAIIVSLGIAISGSVLFDWVNPRILAASPYEIMFEALGRRDCPRAVMLSPERWNTWSFDVYAQYVPRCPLSYLEYQRAADEPLAQAAGWEVAFWTPGEEEEYGISRAVCKAHPQAELFEVADRVGQSKAFAARIGGKWQPQVAAKRWTTRACGERLDTEAMRAEAAMDEARMLLEAQQRDGAIDVLRAAGRELFVQAALFDRLALLLLERRRDRADLDEAVFWARRAAIADLGGDPRTLLTLVRAYAAAGEREKALATADLGLDAARHRDDLSSAEALAEARRQITLAAP